MNKISQFLNKPLNEHTNVFYRRVIAVIFGAIYAVIITVVSAICFVISTIFEISIGILEFVEIWYKTIARGWTEFFVPWWIGVKND